MNYQHSYHAGNFADVFKHWILMLILKNLQKKAAPFIYIDTHAGSGLYDLESVEARKTAEAHEGIKILWDNKLQLGSSLSDYLDIIKTFQNDPSKLRYYPGSPCLAQCLLRSQDKILLNELHPNSASQLKTHFQHDSRASIHSQNAYQWLLGALPPKIPRGLVLIDPPFEQKDEYAQILKLLASSLKRWRQGVFVVWYPITKNQNLGSFYQSLKKAGISNVLNAQLSIYDADSPLGLNGSGMLIINPPWQLDKQIEKGLKSLWELLSSKKKGAYQLNHFI